MTTLAGQTVLVVGGSSGIGYGVAKLSLLSQASHVIIASSNKAKVDNAIARLVSEVPDAKGRVKGEIVDAKQTKEVKALMERVGELDHLVWTSGEPFSFSGVFPNVDIEDYKGTFVFPYLSTLRLKFVGRNV